MRGSWGLAILVCFVLVHLTWNSAVTIWLQKKEDELRHLDFTFIAFNGSKAQMSSQSVFLFLEPYVNYMERTTEPGFPRQVKTNDPGVKKAAKFAVYEYNNRSNDIFVFKILDIDKAMIQVVKGLKYMLNARIGRTVCQKNEHYKLKKCEFQTDKTLKKTLNCYFEIWIVSWLNMVKVPVVACQD